MSRTSWLCEIRHRVGFRGTALLILAVFDFGYGWTKMIHPDAVSAGSQQMRLLAQLMPVEDPHVALVAWGFLWWMTGAFCLFNAFRKNDKWGFGPAMGIKVAWLAANCWAVSQGLVGGGAILWTWVCVLALVTLTAFWSEPIRDTERIAVIHSKDLPEVVAVDEHGRSPGDDDPRLQVEPTEKDTE